MSYKKKKNKNRCHKCSPSKKASTKTPKEKSIKVKVPEDYYE